jgi:hypothetical protein
MPPVTGMMKAYCTESQRHALHNMFIHTVRTYHPFEVARDTIEAHTEARCFEFLRCSRPFHVDTA